MDCKNGCNCSKKKDSAKFEADLKILKAAIEDSNDILIFSHVNPDGDTIGSTLALALVIEKYFSKNVTPVYMGTFPQIYSFLPGANKYKPVAEIDLKKKYDLVISVDVASKERMSIGLSAFEKANLSVNIDHHKTNNNFGKINFVNSEASSAGEVIYNICEKLDLMLDKDIATCLYNAILTDTGGFKYENTTSRTLMVAGVLVSCGANPTEIYRACYEAKPRAMVQLQAFAVNEAVFLNDGKIAYTIITKEIMQKFSAADDFTDGVAEALRQINTVEVSMVLKETNDKFTKVSLRSKNVDVSKIALNFGGGGHEFAAGCTVKKPLQVALNKLLEYIRSEL